MGEPGLCFLLWLLPQDNSSGGQSPDVNREGESIPSAFAPHGCTKVLLAAVAAVLEPGPRMALVPLIATSCPVGTTSISRVPTTRKLVLAGVSDVGHGFSPGLPEHIF